MDGVNEFQVQSTNDASTISKYSAVTKNYFKDDFIKEFVGRKKSRAPLIHLGYYARAVIMQKLVSRFVDFVSSQKFPKIVSLGAGFDTSYWRLTSSNILASEFVFVEIDFSNVIKKKMDLIKQSAKLRTYLNDISSWKTKGGINELSCNYFLIEADLSDVNLIEQCFKNINIVFDNATLFLSECVITYMKESHSRELIKWIAGKFKNCLFLNYEQIHPDDGFGQAMMDHFSKLHSPLFSVREYPNCESHLARYRNLGFENSVPLSEWYALLWLTAESEIQRVLTLELFDEFEEFHLKCVHYVIAISGNGLLSHWMNFVVNHSQLQGINREILKAEVLECNLEVFRHSRCKINENSFVFGGCNRQGRSSVIYKINFTPDLNIQKFDVDDDLSLDMVYGSVVYFELNKTSYVCIYGGRTSPDKIWNDGCPVVFELKNNKFILKCVLNEEKPVSRYRCPMVCLNQTENEVYCWIFGGRTTDLNILLDDFWELSFKHDNQRNLIYVWKQHKMTQANWPTNRMSHSFTANPEKSELIIAAGLKVNSSTVLNDVWKWSCDSESWEEMQLFGELLPRYGHTAHVHNEDLYLVGGVNTLAGMQPGVAKIHMGNRTVVEYTVQVDFTKPVLLFNHTSDLVIDNDDPRIYVLGGGGNCFSFGTHLNSCALCVRLHSFT